MTNNRYAIYLGCMCLLIGGAGLAYKSVSDRSPASVQADATPATVGAGGQQNQWPPANSSVAFHNEMVDLLSPATTEGTAARPQQPASSPPQQQQQAAPATPPQQSAPAPQQQSAPPQSGQQAAAPSPAPQQQAAPRDRIREAPPEPRNSRNARRERERTPEPAPDDTAGTVGRGNDSAGTRSRAERSEPSGDERDGRREIRGRNGTRVIIERDGSRTVVDRRGRVVQERGQSSRDEVVGRDGRRYRIDRGERAEQDGPPSDAPRLRRIEPERPPPPEYRGPDRPIPGLFGIFGGNW